MRWQVVLVACALGGSSPAMACPTGATLCAASDEAAPPVTVTYTRSAPGLPGESGFVRFLTESTWTTQVSSDERRTIRFADPKQPLDARILRGNTMFITRVAKDSPVIEIDGIAYTLGPCPDARARACLVSRPSDRPRIERMIDLLLRR